MFDQLENAINGRIAAENLSASAVTTAKIADGAVTQAKVADGVGRVASGDYTGDGTVDRVITLTFTPKWVHVLRNDNSTEFYSIKSAASTRAWWRVAAGTSANGAADWQGAVTLGFKVGSGAGGGTSNASGVVYSYFAEG